MSNSLDELGRLHDPITVCGEQYFLRVPTTSADVSLLTEEQERSRKHKVDETNAGEDLTRISAAAVAVCIRDEKRKDQAEPVFTVQRAIAAMRRAADYEQVNELDTQLVQKAMVLTGLGESQRTVGKVLRSEDAQSNPSNNTTKSPNTPNTCLLYTSPSPRDS